MLDTIRARHRRNTLFKKNLPLYRFALRKWMWRGKKRMTQDVHQRWEIVREIEHRIFYWQTQLNWLDWFFIEPPEDYIKEVLSWR